MCKKIRYETEEDAQLYLNYIHTRRLMFPHDYKNRHEIRYYYCQECDGHHLTSQPKKNTAII